LIREPVRKESFGMCKWEDIIKMELDGSGWIHVTQSEKKWQVFVDNESLTFVKCGEF
jgi:hypothetical protein